MLYTIYPVEDVLRDIASERYPVTRTVQVRSGMLEVEDLPEGQMRVVRLVSSEPQAYLNPDYQPGSILNCGMEW
jgi:hypothetical protein